MTKRLIGTLAPYRDMKVQTVQDNINAWGSESDAKIANKTFAIYENMSFLCSSYTLTKRVVQDAYKYNNLQPAVLKVELETPMIKPDCIRSNL